MCGPTGRKFYIVYSYDFISRFYLPIPVKDIEIIVKDVKRANRLAITCIKNCFFAIIMLLCAGNAKIAF